MTFSFNFSQMLDTAFFLPNIGSGSETKAQYAQLVQALEEYVRKTHIEFQAVMEKVRIFFDNFSVSARIKLAITFLISSKYLKRRTFCHVNPGKIKQTPLLF